MKATINGRKPIVNFRRTLINLLISSLVYLLFVALARIGVADFASELLLIILHLGSAISLYVYWKCEKWGQAKYDSFGAALLLLSAFFQLIGIVDVILFGTRFDEWPWTIPITSSIEMFAFKAEIISHLGLVILVASWRVTLGGRLEKMCVKNASVKLKKGPLIALYLFALLAIFFTRFMKISFGSLDNVSGAIQTVGVAAIYYFSVDQAGKYRKIAMAGVLGLPLAFLSISSGMKEAIFFPLIPVAAILWTTFRSYGSRAAILLVGVNLLFVAQIFVTQLRQEVWIKGEQNSNFELAAGAIQKGASDGYMAGLGDVMSRINPTLARAITIGVAERDGYLPFEILAPIPASFVPRFIWPEKPVLRPGQMHTERIYLREFVDGEIRSSTAAGFFAELYLGGGWVGLILISGMFGFVAAKIQAAALKIVPGFGLAALNFSLLYSALRFDERHVVYQFTGSVLFLILLIIIVRGSALFVRARLVQ